MRTPITYYGGKQRLAPIIVEMMPAHKLYCEPYFGGGAVFFAKSKSKIEVINDHDNNLINFYTCVQNRFEELQNLIRQTLHSETMYYQAKDIWNGRITASDIEKAWAVWFITNGSFASSMHGGWKWCNGTSGSHTGNYLKGKRNEFSMQLHHRLESVQISCRDAIRVIKERDAEDTFFYLDPPYPGAYQGHYRGFSIENLEELLNILSSIRGKFILSNYMTETLLQKIELSGWNYREIDVSLNVTNKGGPNHDKKSQKRTEVLVYNYDIQLGLFD